MNTEAIMFFEKKLTTAATAEEVKYFNIAITALKEQRPHAHWIEYDDGDVQVCSNCGEEHEWGDYRAPFCDNCGAIMS